MWAYTVVRNEAFMLPWWLQHYRRFCERLIVFDDDSTDGTAELARKADAEVRTYPGSGLDDGLMVGLANETYRAARGHADYVIWTDADEHIYWPGDILARLDQLKQAGVTLPHVKGFNMVHAAGELDPARPLEAQVVEGFPDYWYDKPCVVDPAIDIEWTVGKHTAKYSPFVDRGRPLGLALLHYRYLGPGTVEAHNARNEARKTDHERAQGWGTMRPEAEYQRPLSPVMDWLQAAV